MPELPLTFEVFCAKCGEGICHLVEEGKTPRRGMPFIRVTPCDTCMDNAVFDAKKEGHDAGYSEGLDAGLDRGRAEGYTDGRHDGFDEARAEA